MKSRLASKQKERKLESDKQKVLGLIDEAKSELTSLVENTKAVGIDLEIIDSRTQIGIFSYEPYANYIARYIQNIDENSIKLKELLLSIKYSIDVAVEKLNRDLQNM